MARNEHHLKWFSSYILLKKVTFLPIFRSSRERVGRESGTVTCHVSLFKCPGWKFVGKVWNFCVLLLDDVPSQWMFKWRSGALARAQIYLLNDKTLGGSWFRPPRQSRGGRAIFSSDCYNWLQLNVNSSVFIKRPCKIWLHYKGSINLYV